MQNERKVEKKVINQTFKEAHKLILDYMCEGNKDDIDAVHDLDMYWSKEKIEKEAKTLHGNSPQASLLKVDS
jgi:hypothetical protein